MKKNILSVIGAATVAAVALKLTTKYVKNEVIKELEDDGYLYDDDDCDDCDECCGCDERIFTLRPSLEAFAQQGRKAIISSYREIKDMMGLFRPCAKMDFVLVE